MFLGPFTGLPYKVYALQAATLPTNFAVFLLVSFPARLLRFVLVSVSTAVVGRWLNRYLDLRRQRTILVVAWIAFYAVFFA